ncbi:MAG: hypothetical protein GY896_24880 [Gammaproteobacteria bacterium]|nr:hypothetical protein [Gammaproteobacteria bacterium]
MRDQQLELRGFYNLCRHRADHDQSHTDKDFWIYKFPGLLLHFADFTFNAESVFPIDTGKIRLQH